MLANIVNNISKTRRSAQKYGGEYIECIQTAEKILIILNN